MFTGIITDLGRIREVTRGGGTRFVFEPASGTDGIEPGDSIACSGVCLTVTETGRGWFSAEVSAETLSRTTLASWEPETRVNFERSLRLGDEMGGHFVFGHVDGVGRITDRRAEGDSLRFTFEAPDELVAYIAAKGSIAVDGVSLTVNEVQGSRFGVNIVPYTRDHTTFGEKRPGDAVNIEIDMLARYVARLLGKT